jgi:hypothetical protein
MSPRLQHFLHCCILLIFILSLILVQPGLAAAPTAAPLPQADKPDLDDIRFGRNSETGKLSFVGGDRGQPLIRQGEVGAQSVEAAGMTVIRRYAAQFGLQDPTRNLRLERVQEETNGTTLRYQQQYRGVPVVGGEMVVNTDADGNVLSLNGEVSPDLSLASVTPTITAEQARQIALQGMQEWHAIAPEGAEVTEPELWLYDERIFHESTKPVALVWRMEVTPLDFIAPVHEFVLVDARTGEIALHFNQVDTSWHYQEEEPTPTLTLEPALEPTPTDTPTIEPSPTEMPTAQPAPTETPTPEPTMQPAPQELSEEISDEGGTEDMILSGPTRYLSTSGSDTGDCGTPATACRTFTYTYSQSSAGTTMYISGGSFSIPSAITISHDSLHLSGGWNTAFTLQNSGTRFFGSSGYNAFWIYANNVRLSNLTIWLFDTAIYISSSKSLILDDVVLTNNANSGIENHGTITISNSAFVKNAIGIRNYGVGSALNSTIGENTSIGVYNQGQLSLLHVTIANNATKISNQSSGLTVKNSILAGSGSCSGTILSAGYNIVESCSSFQSQPSDWMGINPKIGRLINTKYYPLLEGSPAINYVPETCADCPAFDVRGASRPTNNRYDAGAYEYLEPGTPVVVLPYAGNQEVTGSNRVFTVPLAALVLDSMGSPVPNVVVNFRAPAAGPSAVFTSTGSNETSTTTGPDGLAIPGDLTANAIRGWFTVNLSTPSLLTNSFMLYIIDLFVRQDGSNSDSDCTNIAAPCQTFAHAISKAMPGASILLAGGVHDVPSQLPISVENLFISGDWNSNFTVQNQSTILDGITRSHSIDVTKNIHFSNLTFRNFYFGLIVGAQTATVENSSFISNSTGIYISSSGTLNLINATVSQNTSYGIYGHGKLNILSSTIVNQPEGITNYGKVWITSSIVALNNKNCSGYTNASGGYNIFGASCSGLKATDQLLTDPKIGPLIKSRHHPLMSSSPAVDKIPYTELSACPAKDIRAVSRPFGEKCDVGAFEYTPPGPAVDIQVSNGSNQVSGTGRTFVQPLEALVFDAQGSPVSGISVTFSAPASGPSAVFKDSGSSTYVAVTNEQGVAVAWTAANNLTGSYSVTASRTGAAGTVSFSLSNINLYVSTTGADTSNDCRNAGSPCRTLYYTLTKAVRGAGILLTAGDHWITYTTSISLNELSISGGWNSDFTQQKGFTYLRGKDYQVLQVNSRSIMFENMVFLEMSGVTISSTGSASLTNSASVNNTTGITNKGSLTLLNSTISGNRSAGLSNYGTATIINSTLTDNRVRAIDQTSSSASITLQNSIIGAQQVCNISSGKIQTKGNNIFSSDCAKPVSIMSSDYVGDARVSELINNTYHALLPGSPAIDVIDPAASDVYCPATDQRGIPRPTGARCDIGAYEYTIPGAAASLILSGSEQIIGLLQEPMVPLQVQVTDSIGAPIAGVPVTFIAPSSGASGSFNGSLTSVVQTNASGIAAPKGYRANNISGSYLIQVSLPGLTSVTFALNNSSGLYVNVNTGNDSANNCRSSAAPCKTIAAAVSSASAGDTILIAQGNYPASNLTISKNLFLSGGWTTNFATQSGISLSEASSTMHFSVNSSASLSIDRMDFVGGSNMITNAGTLRITNSSFRKGCVALSNSGILSLTNVSIYSIVCTNNNNAAIVNSNGAIQLTNVTIANNISTVRN